MNTFNFYSTPSHGYLEVSKDLIFDLNFDFSICSKRKNGFIYLEEDCDAPAFCEFLKTKNIDFEINAYSINNELFL